MRGAVSKTTLAPFQRDCEMTLIYDIDPPLFQKMFFAIRVYLFYVAICFISSAPLCVHPRDAPRAFGGNGRRICSLPDKMGMGIVFGVSFPTKRR